MKLCTNCTHHSTLNAGRFHLCNHPLLQHPVNGDPMLCAMARIWFADKNLILPCVDWCNIDGKHFEPKLELAEVK